MSSQLYPIKPMFFSQTDPPKVAQDNFTPRLDEYFSETLRHLLAMERVAFIRSDYMQLQYELSLESRQRLLDWIVKGHFAYQLSPHTLFLCVRLLDRFLSLEQVQEEELQLLGLSCLMIASKMEDTLPLTVQDLSIFASDYCSAKDIVTAERNILSLLDYSTIVPCSLDFYEMMIQTISPPLDPHCNFLARYFLELLLCDQTGALAMRPSLQAAACASLAMEMTRADGETWCPPLCFGVTLEELSACKQHLESVYSTAMTTKNHVVRLKFSTTSFQGVAVSLCHTV